MSELDFDKVLDVRGGADDLIMVTRIRAQGSSLFTASSPTSDVVPTEALAVLISAEGLHDKAMRLVLSPEAALDLMVQMMNVLTIIRVDPPPAGQAEADEVNNLLRSRQAPTTKEQA